MSAASIKQQKEDFVSNLSGGAVSEINAVTAVAPVAALVWSILQSRQSFFQPYGPLALVIDYLLNVVAILLSTTLYSSRPTLLSILLVSPAVLTYLVPRKADPSRRRTRVPPADVAAGVGGGRGRARLDPLPMKPFLTTYRASMLVVTTVAILAVDFHLFPRRFAKVETWGTSLMDLGVGAFVFSGGVVAARPVLKERAAAAAAAADAMKETGSGSRSSPSALRRIVGSMRSSLPLLVLGVIRLLSVKGLDYAEHVTEYGVHWNFFFTMGMLPPFVAASQAALAYVPSYAALALFVSGAYQVLLETTALKAWILTAPRVDLISMNREGIFSFFGYLAIFLAGQDLGMFVLPRRLGRRGGGSGAAAPTAGSERNALLLSLAVWAAVWSGLYWLSTSYRFGLGLDVSRRLANLPYVLWVAAFNSAMVLAYCLVDTVFFPAFYNAVDAAAERTAYDAATSRVMRAYNRNGLFIFLVSNLLTGLVNMSVNTLEAGPVLTMGILVAYTSVNTAVALILDAYDVSIKL